VIAVTEQHPTSAENWGGLQKGFFNYMAENMRKPGTDERAAWWEGKSPVKIIFGLFHPLYALRNDNRPVTAKRVIIGLGIGVALILVSYLSRK